MPRYEAVNCISALLLLPSDFENSNLGNAAKPYRLSSYLLVALTMSSTTIVSFSSVKSTSDLDGASKLAALSADYRHAKLSSHSHALLLSLNDMRPQLCRQMVLRL
jgi:hypothetical protein